MRFLDIFFFSSHLDRARLDGAGTRAFYLSKSFSSFFSYCASLEKGRLCLLFDQRSSNLFVWPTFSSKPFAAIKALLLRQNYIRAKHANFIIPFALYLIFRFFRPRFVYVHFIWGFPFFRALGRGKVLIIDTHNYDPQWWDNLSSNSKSMLSKRICFISKQSILTTLKELPENTLLIHVSDEDAIKYKLHRPDLTHLVIPNGCTMRPRGSGPDYSAQKKNIYFLGALNLQITRDAILHFDKDYWPLFSGYSDFHLIGSGPAGFWKPFCAERGWHLHNNVPDDALTRLLEGMHYLVLPFTYGAGSKLKFIDACARGIPVISTPPGVCGFSNLPPTVRISENPKDWVKWISSSQGPTEAEVTSCLTFAKEFSWDNLVAKVWPQIQNHPPVP
jgi:hypothetical protein